MTHGIAAMPTFLKPTNRSLEPMMMVSPIIQRVILSLDKIEILRIIIKQPIELEFEYGATNEVMRLVNDFTLEITKQHFMDSCRISALIPPGDLDKFIPRGSLIKGFKITHREV